MVLRQCLADAGAHAMRMRSAPGSTIDVVLEVLPVGIEVRVATNVRERKQLIGWETIESARMNPLIERIDYLAETINNRQSS